jgi:2-polyprenyl-3-methyl-5-hydroxy-6-metoxy-1,4-benzoquinol methylase
MVVEKLAMRKNNVRKLYAFLNAKWYDPFKKIWNVIISRKSEKDLEKFLKNNLNETKTILELGCGTALNVQKIFSLNIKFKKYTGMDFTPEMLEIARKKFPKTPNVEFHQKDITNLTGIKEKYDIIISTWVMSHLKNQSEVVNEAQKLLKPDGKMFLIFFSKAKWFLHILVYLPAKLIFNSKEVPESEIQKFKNVKSRQSYITNMVTTIEIQR